MKTPYSHPERMAGILIQESLPSTSQCLTAGGDARIALDAVSGLNLYGCRPFPDPAMLAYGSSTASIISMEGYRCANRLRERLLEAVGTASHSAVYDREIGRIRAELLQLCELPETTGTIFSPSGTDIHTIAAQYAGRGVLSMPPLIVMIETNETGKGVAAALEGTGFAEQPDCRTADAVQVSVRLGDGTPRLSIDIDTEVEALVSAAVVSNRRVLLILIDQSKTGLIAPSQCCVQALHDRFKNKIDVLVDACQFRIAPPTLRAYLEQGFMVALTGSKFLTGPSFSGVLLFSSALNNSSALENRPSNGVMTKNVTQIANFGLLLRWEVALQELRAFRSIPQATVIGFLQDFSSAIQQRLNTDPLLESLPVPQLDRRPLTAANSWDHLQTIFPFLLYHADAGGTPLSAEETLHVYRQLSVNLNVSAKDNDTGVSLSNFKNSPEGGGFRPVRYPDEDHAFNPEHPDALVVALRCQIGQPVACGKRNGVAVSALRLCISTRLIVKAAADGDKGVAVIEAALVVLDKTALLIRSLPTTAYSGST